MKNRPKALPSVAIFRQNAVSYAPSSFARPIMKRLFSRIKPYAKSFLQAAVLFAVFSLAADWWRKPDSSAQFQSEPLHLLSGETETPESLSRNRVAVLYIWGDWCSICAFTSPIVSRLAQDGVPVAGIALRSGTDGHIRAYMSEKHLDFPTANDRNGDLARKWNISVTPSIILMKNGKMVHFTSGISTYWGLRTRIFLSDIFY